MGVCGTKVPPEWNTSQKLIKEEHQPMQEQQEVEEKEDEDEYTSDYHMDDSKSDDIKSDVYAQSYEVNSEDLSETYQYCKYQSPLDIIRKRPLIINGYIREYQPLCPQELIEIIHNFCFIKILNYEIKTIGNNAFGQQGIDNYKNVTTLRTVKTFQKNIKHIMNGDKNIYILFTDGSVQCCGSNKYGQLGINMNNSHINTFVENNNIKIKNIFTSPSSYQAFCINDNNIIHACGYNYNNKWSEMYTQTQIEKVSTGWAYTIFINTNGQLFACGHDSGGALGLGQQIKDINTITQIPIKTKFMDIYCGYLHTLALDCYGQIWSWGNGTSGELGHGDLHNRYKPTKVEYFINRNIKIIQICCGWRHSLVLSNLNRVYEFGDNYDDECVTNSNEWVLTPQLNETLKHENIVAIKCGQTHNVAMTDANEYYLWGLNEFNQCLCISNDPPEYVKNPLLFEYKYFIETNQQIIDIFLGTLSTRVLIGNEDENVKL